MIIAIKWEYQLSTEKGSPFSIGIENIKKLK
jgi:hypothetical protein